MTEPATTDDTLLVLAPSGRDGPVLTALLAGAGIACRLDETGELLLAALESGEAAGAIITDEALTRIGLAALRNAAERQPPWSDFPFVLLARRGAARETRHVEELLNATLLERPSHPDSLISAARSAIRSRQRQRIAAKHLAEREAARAELKELADTLETKVRERTRDLATANDRLTAEIAERERAEAWLVQAQKMEAVGQLTGGVAHDFNNLLTAVIGSLDLLLRRLDDERSKRLASNAMQAAERGAKLTSQLLAFSRRQRLSPVAVDANQAISAMGDLLARSIGSRIRIETRLERRLWAALADPTQLEMMIINLAINARDAMPSGGTLRISTSNLSQVPEDLKDELPGGEYVCISVSDTGVGMAPDVRARAFEPFFTTKEQGKGTGLGLSQLYGFAKQSGGTASIASEEGKGTTVTIILPRTEGQPGSDRLRPNGTGAKGQARILIVDDDDDVRAAAAAMVEELGYPQAAVDSGPEALKLLGRKSFDLVITDLMMPGMNGIELARQISAMDSPPRILFATGYADIEELGADLDDDKLIRKPFRLSEIEERIGDALAQPVQDRDVIDLKRERDRRAK